MQGYIISYFVVLAAMVALDLLWLGVLMKDFYRSGIGHLMAHKVRVGAAAAFYLVFVAGLFYFAVAPVLHHHIWQAAAWLGAAYGFFTYATYDLSNLATLKQWPLKVALADIAWGTVLGGVLGTIGFLLASFF